MSLPHSRLEPEVQTAPVVAQLVIKTSTSAAYQLSVQRWSWRYLARTRLHHRHIQISRFYKNTTEVLITAFLILSFTRSRNLECVRVFCYSSLSSFDSWSYQLVCWSTQGQSLIVTLPAVDAAPSYSPACSPSHDMRPASSWRSRTHLISHIADSPQCLPGCDMSADDKAFCQGAFWVSSLSLRSTWLFGTSGPAKRAYYIFLLKEEMFVCACVSEKRLERF